MADSRPDGRGESSGEVGQTCGQLGGSHRPEVRAVCVCVCVCVRRIMWKRRLPSLASVFAFRPVLHFDKACSDVHVGLDNGIHCLRGGARRWGGGGGGGAQASEKLGEGQCCVCEAVRSGCEATGGLRRRAAEQEPIGGRAVLTCAFCAGSSFSVSSMSLTFSVERPSPRLNHRKIPRELAYTPIAASYDA